MSACSMRSVDRPELPAALPFGYFALPNQRFNVHSGGDCEGRCAISAASEVRVSNVQTKSVFAAVVTLKRVESAVLRCGPPRLSGRSEENDVDRAFRFMWLGDDGDNDALEPGVADEGFDLGLAAEEGAFDSALGEENECLRSRRSGRR